MSFSQRKEPPGRSASARCAQAWLPRHEALGAEGLRGSAACCLRLSGYWGLAEAGRELPPAGHAASGFSWSIASRGLSEQRPRVSGSRDDPSAWPSGPGWHPLSLPGPCFVSSSAPAHFVPLLPSPAKVAAFGRPRPRGDPVQVPSPCLVSHSEAGAVPVGRTPHAASGCRSTAPRLRAHEVARASDSHSLLLPRGGTTDFIGKGDWKSLESPRAQPALKPGPPGGGDPGTPVARAGASPGVPTTANMTSGTLARTCTLSLPRGGVRPGHLGKAGVANAFPGRGPTAQVSHYMSSPWIPVLTPRVLRTWTAGSL